MLPVRGLPDWADSMMFRDVNATICFCTKKAKACTLAFFSTYRHALGSVKLLTAESSLVKTSLQLSSSAKTLEYYDYSSKIENCNQ